MFNKLTSLYSKIYYKEENYLKIKTVVFKYITPPIVKVEYVGILVYLVYCVSNIPVFPRSKLLVMCYLCDLAYPSSYSFTGSISPASYTLILTQYKSLFSTCTILLIRSVTKMLNKIKIVKLSKELLSMAYREKKKYIIS